MRRYLQEPLSKAVRALLELGQPAPQILILLDALDESDHDGQGWLPMAHLVARE